MSDLIILHGCTYRAGSESESAVTRAKPSNDWLSDDLRERVFGCMYMQIVLDRSSGVEV